MSTLKFDTKDAVSKQNFINLRLAGFSLFDISDALGVSYPTIKRIYDELKPEINSQIAKTKRFDHSALTKKIESFLNALEKHFYIMEEGMIETHNNMNYEQYIASILKFTNAFEKLVKLRILLNSSQIQQDVSQSKFTNANDPYDPENGSIEINVPQPSLDAENDENVPQPSLVAESDENVPQPSLLAENAENVPQASCLRKNTDSCDPENGSNGNTKNDENVPQPSLVAENNINDSTTANDPCDPENGSTVINVPQILSRDLGTSCLRKNSDPCDPENGSINNSGIDEKIPNPSLKEDDYPPDKNLNVRDNISYYKYRKHKIAKIRKKDKKYL